MPLYVLLKKQGSWPNGSSEPVVRALLDLIDLNDKLVYENGRPVLKDSKYHISVSHSDQVMVVAILSQKVGIDIEKNKPVKPEVIKRLSLDPKEPLVDWCTREALIKLYDDPHRLLVPKDEISHARIEDVFDGYTCVMASEMPLPPSVIYHLDENAL